MRLYFDTNVYRYVRETDELPRMRDLFATYDCTLEASSSNLFETFAIVSTKEQRAETETLVQLADIFEDRPVSWHHSIELREELRRKRPTWIRQVNFTRKAKGFLKAHADRWELTRELDLPQHEAYAAYARDAEAGIANQRDLQKELRASHPDRGHFTLGGQSISFDISDPNVFWRADCLMAWYAAIEFASPESRDYADWLSPFLKPGAFNDASYLAFWMQDASDEEMRLNRITGLMSFYQLEHKITHGNAADKLHANHWLLSDLFFTADVRFYKALRKVADLHFPHLRKPVLLDRSAKSCVVQVEQSLEDYHARAL